MSLFLFFYSSIFFPLFFSNIPGTLFPPKVCRKTFFFLQVSYIFYNEETTKLRLAVEVLRAKEGTHRSCRGLNVAVSRVTYEVSSWYIL